MKRLKYLSYLLSTLVFLCSCEAPINQVVDKKESKSSEFNAVGVPPGTESKYDLMIEMDKSETFTVKASILIKNISNDTWHEIPFYLIPNMFTAENSPSLETPSNLNMIEVSLNEKIIEFTLQKDTLTIPLTTAVAPNETVNVEFLYNFTLPEKGLRFTKKESNFYLAQWYPMVPTYRNGWNKEDYRFKGESYHTPYSDFLLTYTVPSNYTVVTTSEEDEKLRNNGNVYKINNVKEVFLALLESPNVVERQVKNTNIRVFGLDGHSEEEYEIAAIAKDALEYFQEHIGTYPYSQFDIILDSMGMEYPGVVTAGSYYNTKRVNTDSLKSMVVHEVAHQWFYGMISNDPYNDAWLDEGLSELATLLYYSDRGETNFSFEFGNEFSKDLPLPVNLSLDDYPMIEQSSYIYGKASTKLGMLFQKYGGKEKAEDFLKAYFHHYQHKEVNTEEFVRFMKFFLKLENDKDFKDWLEGY
ncbi:M1 family metallopeptidase [Alkalihalobacillus macyae]|uniref:M1 family metallopeptidase n=1 Tax=Guptibacillus hwajinpoensis TaxID=208199 RepID=UPI00273B7E1A|nr:M1 family metallopeptidase [Alkalihalobacillus macyae]MDP4549658.1 M1 family metallopeptidase [Alkalihalobacillus macyae]